VRTDLILFHTASKLMRPMASETPNAVQRIVSQLPLTTVPFTMLNGSAAEKNARAR